VGSTLAIGGRAAAQKWRHLGSAGQQTWSSCAKPACQKTQSIAPPFLALGRASWQVETHEVKAQDLAVTGLTIRQTSPRLLADSATGAPAQ
jgi:hypothetical protein